MVKLNANREAQDNGNKHEIDPRRLASHLVQVKDLTSLQCSFRRTSTHKTTSATFHLLYVFDMFHTCFYKNFLFGLCNPACLDCSEAGRHLGRTYLIEIANALGLRLLVRFHELVHPRVGPLFNLLVGRKRPRDIHL